LSLDTQEIDAEVDRVLSADGPLPLPGFESVVARNVRPIASAHRLHTRRLYQSAASLVLVVAGCSGVYVWWRDPNSIISLKSVIDRVGALAKPLAAIANSSTHKFPPPPETVTPVVAPVSVASDAKPVEAEDGVVPSPGATSDHAASDHAASAYTASDYKVLLDLMAHEATWLSVSSDGRPVFSGILQAHQTKSVGGREFAQLRVGNAAGIEVRLNGRLLAPLGARGQVLMVLFTPGNFQILSPPKESD